MYTKTEHVQKTSKRFILLIFKGQWWVRKGQEKKVYKRGDNFHTSVQNFQASPVATPPLPYVCFFGLEFSFLPTPLS